jgi:hypothetical protein
VDERAAPGNRVKNAGLTMATSMRCITVRKVSSARPCRAGITATTNARETPASRDR